MSREAEMEEEKEENQLDRPEEEWDEVRGKGPEAGVEWVEAEVGEVRGAKALGVPVGEVLGEVTEDRSDEGEGGGESRGGGGGTTAPAAGEVVETIFGLKRMEERVGLEGEGGGFDFDRWLGCGEGGGGVRRG